MVDSPPAKKQRRKAPKSNTGKGSGGTDGGGASVLGVTRSISACQRCRNRKTKCDQKFPSCTACFKANVECVGIDAATGREIPRSYVSHLEDRIAQLESQLHDHGISTDSRPSEPSSYLSSTNQHASKANPKASGADKTSNATTASSASTVNNLMTSVQMVDDRMATSEKQSSFLGQSSGLSFARILSTAVKLRNQDGSKSSDDNNSNSGQPNTGNKGTSSSKPLAVPKPKPKPAKLPPKETAEAFLSAYFSQANSQLPVLHREEFLKNYFEPIYGKLSTKVSLCSDYTAIGREASDEPDKECFFAKYCQTDEENEKNSQGQPNPALFFLFMVFGIATSIHQQQYPAHISESYRISAAHHFDAVFAAPNRLESLQAILLLALYSLMRPAVPGVWYVLGSALRLCIDLGLHYEGSVKSKSSLSDPTNFNGTANFDPITVDLRRRLFWCTYALDRQVCVYLGRPFGIPDESIKVPFPSELDDSLINSDAGNIADFSKETSNSPSYKTVSLSFFKMRLLQSEIQRVLYDCAELPRRYKSLSEWKHAMARKLEEWHNQCPKSNRKMNCNFNLAFFELNYHQTRLLLYGLSPGNSAPTVESYLIIADAGEKIIKKYHELHRKRVINYTWVAVHNLFMSGTSYLYALYHSPQVRAGTTLEEIDFNTLACIHVLSSMTDCCDAAVGCRDSFELLTAAIIKLCYNEKAGIVMQLPGSGSRNSSTQQSTDGTAQPQQQQQSLDQFNNPLRSNISTPLSLSRRQSVTGANSVKKEGGGEDEIGPLTPTAAGGSNMTEFSHPNEVQWPMPDDLELFFQEAAQLEGVSPDSIRTGGTSGSPDASSNTPWGPYSSNPDGEDSVMLDGSSLKPQNNQPHQHQPHNHHHHHHHHNNDQQRIYDIISGVPLAPIWDQFFAPPPNNSDPNANSNQPNNSVGPMSDVYSSRWQPQF
jgi:hypothetical protein